MCYPKCKVSTREQKAVSAFCLWMRQLPPEYFLLGLGAASTLNHALVLISEETPVCGVRHKPFTLPVYESLLPCSFKACLVLRNTSSPFGYWLRYLSLWIFILTPMYSYPLYTPKRGYSARQIVPGFCRSLMLSWKGRLFINALISSNSSLDYFYPLLK